MIEQKNVLTALGCSGSLLLSLAFHHPATAASNPQSFVEAEQGYPTTAVSQKDHLGDLIGCGCAVCQGMPIETGL